MTYPMTIAGLRRELPLCKVADDFYIGAFIMFGDAQKRSDIVYLEKLPTFNADGTVKG